MGENLRVIFGFLIDNRMREVEYLLAVARSCQQFIEGEAMQESVQIKTDQKSEQQSEKKPYVSPQLSRHGVVEDLTKEPVSSLSQGNIEFSDRNLKENFAPVDVTDVLQKLAQVRISTWNYKSDAETVRHIGPMAQDFAKAFGVGDSDRVIHNVDSGGVTMAAVQALHQMVLEQNQRIAALETEVRELREAAVAV